MKKRNLIVVCVCMGTLVVHVLIYFLLAYAKRDVKEMFPMVKEVKKNNACVNNPILRYPVITEEVYDDFDYDSGCFGPV